MSPITLPPQSYLAWKIAVVSLHLLSIISTTGRLIHRFRVRQAWWDDYIVTIPLVFETVFFSLVWVRFPHKELESGGQSPPDSWRQQVLNSYWLTTLPCIIILWSTRSVLALSLARIFPQKHTARRCAFALVGFMTLACIASVAITIATCKQTSVLLSPDETQSCVKALGGYILKDLLLSVGDLISSVLILLTSVWILRFVTVPETVRHMVVMVLLGSILTILCAVAFLVICMSSDSSIAIEGATNLMITSLGNLESAVTLFVCNLAILSACFYPWLRRLFLCGCHHRPRPRAGTTTTTHPAQTYSLADELVDGCSSCPTPLTLTELSDFSSPSLQQRDGSSGRHSNTNYSDHDQQSIAYVNRSSIDLESGRSQSDEKRSEEKSESSVYV